MNSIELYKTFSACRIALGRILFVEGVRSLSIVDPLGAGARWGLVTIDRRLRWFQESVKVRGGHR